jgi:GrpB-like predicted nucleotidyltransferase (UPF0157 family)
MIGLRRHTVCLVEHDPEWAALFAIEAVNLRERIGQLVADIQHVGSTAVPGLPAKPILDIAVAVSAPETIAVVASRLRASGYLDRGDAARDGGYLLVKESSPDVRIVHLHIVEQSDDQWRHYIAFRDVLRRDATIRRRYADLKRTLAERCQDDRKSYTALKENFIKGVLSHSAGQDPQTGRM